MLTPLFERKSATVTHHIGVSSGQMLTKNEAGDTRLPGLGSNSRRGIPCRRTTLRINTEVQQPQAHVPALLELRCAAVEMTVDLPKAGRDKGFRLNVLSTNRARANIMLVEIEAPDGAGIETIEAVDIPDSAARVGADGRTWFQRMVAFGFRSNIVQRPVMLRLRTQSSDGALERPVRPGIAFAAVAVPGTVESSRMPAPIVMRF